MPRERPLFADELAADVDTTIALWQRDGVDCCAVWVALGQSSRVSGWGRVRQYMIRWLAMHDVLPRSEVRRAA